MRDNRRAAPRRGTYIFGFIADVVKGIAGMEQAEDMQNDAQEFNAGQAQIDRDWKTYMDNTRYQRGIQDMKAAGLNPMLAYHQGGAGTPTGSAASSGIGSTGMDSGSYAASQQSASQVEVNHALADKVRAEANEIRERTLNYDPQRREIEARIPRHAADIDKIRQDIGESAVRIEKLWAETKTQGATAANIEQQTRNLGETIPLIRSQVQHFKALTAQESAATDEIKQRVKANLPELERLLSSLEVTSRRMQHSSESNQEAAASSLVGQIGAYLRALNPLQGFIGVVPHGPRTVIHKKR